MPHTVRYNITVTILLIYNPGVVFAISNRHQQENLPQLSDLLYSEHIVFFHKVKVLLKNFIHFTKINV